MADRPAPWAGKLRFLRRHTAFQVAPARTVRRLAWWWVRTRASRPARVSLPHWDVRLDVPPLWRGVPKLIYAFREHYERELLLLDSLLAPGDAVVDAGASLGIYTLAASSLVGSSGRVLAIEPGEASRRWLAHNLALNRAANVAISGVALSDRAGTGTLFHHPDPGRSSLLRLDGRDPRNAERVPTAPLDAILEEAGWTRLDLVKVDVEGAEGPAIRGARTTLDALRPVVIMEVGIAADPPEGGLGAVATLRDLGYRLYRVLEGGMLRPLTGDRIAAGNVLAVHGSDTRTRERLEEAA